jgi:hypothetical protein
MPDDKSVLPREKEDRLNGLDGWLYFIGFGLLIGPIEILGSSQDILSLLFVGVFVYLNFLFYQKKKEFPRYFILTLVVFFVLHLLVYLLSGVATGRGLGASFVQVLIWIPYMLVSKRVKATFIN